MQERPGGPSVDVIGVQEYSSIAVGILAMDDMVKAAPVSVITTRTICPGKFVVLITGDVASVDLALSAGKRDKKSFLVDELFIANLHWRVIPAIRGPVEVKEWDALGIVESYSVTAGIEAADIAAKEAAVEIAEVRLSGGMGGKSTVKVMGAVREVEAAVAASVRWVERKGLLCKQVILAQPHPDIRPFVLNLPHEGADLWK